jgi:hypothetical protein
MLDRARARLLRWRERPIDMVREEFHAEPDAWQAEALHAFAQPENQRIALKACKGPGKTTLEAWAGLNFLATRPNPRIGATSITGDNIDTGLWPEFDKWMQRSKWFTDTFVWTKTRVENRLHPNNCFISKRTWPKTGTEDQQANALAGLHADYVMWIGDEAGGYPQGLMVAMEAIFSSCVEGKILIGGNPTHTTGPLYRACTTDRALWYVVTITGDPDDPKRSPRIKLEWARQQIKQYGRDNPWVMVNVLGQFPPSSINALIGAEEVEAAMRRVLRLQDYEWAQKRLGIDVARFGDDRTVIFPRQGLASFRPIIMRNARTTDIAARAFKSGTKWGAEMYLVDDTGHWGHGVIDNLTVAGAPVVPIVYHAKAINPRYKNRRAEFWIEGTKKLKEGAALPYIPELIAELSEPTYTFLNGVFVLEEKDQIKERLGRSPDLADAYLQTYAIADMPGQLAQMLRGNDRAKRDADPYANDPYSDRPAGRVLHDFDPNE